MYGLADVMCSGDNASAEQQQLSAAEVGDVNVKDRAQFVVESVYADLDFR
jgi:hypothetical protein